MNYCKLVIAIAFFALATKGSAQSTKEQEKYRKTADEIRQQVWAWDKPQFKVRDVPAEFATASKVVIAQHTELTAESKSKFAFYVVSFGVKKEQTITEVVRELVKLNDKTAVTEYSELSFTQFDKRSGFYTKDKTISYVGVRVIKPSGAVKEINADDIVLTKDEKYEKRAKLAIPDLQPGDMLDYFIATEQQMTNDFSDKAYQVLLFDAAPVMNLSFHGQLSKKYAINYRSYNGAPELKVTKNDEEEIIIDVEKTNMPPVETSLWIAAARQSPFIRMNIALGYKGMGSKMINAKKPGEVTRDMDAAEVVNEKAKELSASYYNGYWMKAAKNEYEEIEKIAKKKAKQMGRDYSDLDDREKAELLYYTLRFTKIINFEINNLARTIDAGSYSFNGLAFPLFCLFKAAGLNPAIIVSTSRTGFRMNEIMYSSDLTSTAYLPTIGKYNSMQSAFDIPFETPYEVEGITGTKSFTFDHPNAIMSMNKLNSLARVVDGPNIAVSAADKNAHIENLRLSLSPDKSNLTVQRSTTVKGHYRRDLQKQFILYEDFYEAERKAFNDEKSLIEELQDSRKGKKYADEVTNAFAEARKKQKDAFLSEAKDWFEQEITDLKDYKTDSLGVRSATPNFVYSSTFTMGGLVKKAGNNIIIEVGKMQGQPLRIKDDQRKRTVDVYMPFARTIEYHITLEIPDGYTAEGVPALNKNVTNETGVFIVSATSTEKLVTINVTKQYLHGYEPARNWDKMLEFLDASTDWVNAKLLLKKK